MLRVLLFILVIGAGGYYIYQNPGLLDRLPFDVNVPDFGSRDGQASPQQPEPEEVAGQAPGNTEEETEAAEQPVPRGKQTALKTNQSCINIIKKYEEVDLQAYRGPSGNWLIGYGHKKDVTPGMVISLEQAEAFLKQDLEMIEADIKNRLNRDVANNAFSAMVCLAYNIGTGNFSKSTVLKETNAGNTQAAADAFLLWNKVAVNGGLVVNQKMDARRREEKMLYLSQN